MTESPVNWYEYVKAVRKAFDEYDAALAKAEKATEETMAAFAEIKEWTDAIHLSMLAEASIDRINAATRYHALPSESLETWVSNTWAVRTHENDPSILPRWLVETNIMTGLQNVTELGEPIPTKPYEWGARFRPKEEA